MVTINNYSVSLSLNAGDLIDKSKLARNEISSLSRTLGSLTTPQEKFERALDLAERGLTDEAKAAGYLIEVKERLRQKYLGVTDAVDRQNNAMQRSGLSTTAIASRLGALAAGYLGVHAAASLVGSSIRSAAEVEKSQAAFSVLTGSAEKARNMLAEIRDLSSKSPISFSAATQSARTLLSFNVAANQIMPTLRMLGEITGGDTERFKMLSLAFAQSSAAGRLMGQDLLQMINAGFNPLQEISRKTGRSLVDLKKDMEGGLISFSMVQDAFRSATSEGGLFNGMMDSIGNTSAGAMQKANAAIELLKVSLGESLSPLIREVSNDIARLARESDELKSGLDAAGNSVLGFYNFAKSEISLLPSMARGFGAIGNHLGTLADAYATLNIVAQSKTMQGSAFVDFLDKNYEARKSEIDALIRLNESGLLRDSNGVQSNLSMLITDFQRRLEERSKKAQESLAQNDQNLKAPASAVSKEAEVRQKAEESIARKYQTQVGSLLTSIEKLKESKTAAAGLKAELQGMSDPQKMHIMHLTRQLEMLEKQTKAIKDQATERQRLERQAQSIRDKYATPVEKLAKSLAEINKLQQLEIITPFEAARSKAEAMQEARKGVVEESPMLKAADKLREIEGLRRQGVISEMEARKARDAALTDVVKDIKIEAPKNLEVGSQDAYKFFAQRDNKSQEAALRAERKQEVERQVNAINQVKTAVDQVAANLKRKR